MLQIIILCLALCTDAFVASISYGAGGIRIDWKRIGIMNAIGAACLGAALCFGTAIDLLIPKGLTDVVCAALLFLLGLVRLSDSLIRNYIDRHCEVRKDIHFSFSDLRFILSIYADPVTADSDKDRTLSLKETACFGLAMSIDSLAAGTCAAFMETPILWTLLTAFASGCAAMTLGQLLGRKLAVRLRWDMAWVSGALFLALAFLRMK